MCGIVGALAQRDVTPLLLEGLKRLEYRGYDSSGITVLNPANSSSLLHCVKTEGKVSKLETLLEKQPLAGTVGIGHTRWATHGKPSTLNAHPHISNNEVAVVHNGIIENFEALKTKLLQDGYTFHSDTDTEVIAHFIHQHYKQHNDLGLAIREAAEQMVGSFALGVIHTKEPNRLMGYCCDSPLVVGLGDEEYFIASDPIALLCVSKQFIYLQKNDLVEITPNTVTLYNKKGEKITRPVCEMAGRYKNVDRGEYRHYMLKEIFEQPTAIYNTLTHYLDKEVPFLSATGTKPEANCLQGIEHVYIVACGTSHHAAMVARYWIESLLGLPCQTDIASEFRYRDVAVPPNTLFITLSQSGETADTLAALRKAKSLNYLATLGICNVPNSLLTRECDYLLITKAGTEIGVASTKAFTTQLTAFLLIIRAIYRQKMALQTTAANSLSASAKQQLATLDDDLRQLPYYTEKVLRLDTLIKITSARLAEKQHTLFLGRGAQYPIAKEGALKLKEISYIHAEAYPAGELKHGPIALIDGHIPTILLMPNDGLAQKVKSTLNEVSARGGELIVLTNSPINASDFPHLHLIPMPSVPELFSPIIYTIALQLLAYYTAVSKGTDVDQPRNLAKAVTVE